MARKAKIEAVSVAVIYRRVSTSEQAESGLGLEAQEARCRDFAERAGLTVQDVFTDAGVSGAAELDRCPQLVAALAALPAGGALLVAKRDRLGRDNLRLAMIEREAARKGARITSAAGEGTESDDPSGLLLRRMVDAFAEYERLLIGVRTSAALRAKRARGERLGSTPLGYRTMEDGSVVADAAELETVARVRALRAAGLTLRAIVDVMTAEGRRTKRGGAWQATTVKRILEPRYIERMAA